MHVLVGYVEIGQGVVVLTFYWIVVQNLTIGIVKRTLKTLARTELFVVLENNVRHKTLSTE
jgi:hypothetical protein